MVTSGGGTWSARHAVEAAARRTAALVNALTNAPTTGEAPSAAAVVAVLREHGEPGELDLSERDTAEMRAAALRLREVFAAPGAAEAAARLNGLLALTTGSLRLTSHRGASPWHPHVDSHDDAPWGEWLLASSALALTVLVWDRQCPPGGVCASASCGNVFLTQGGGPPRRYCSRRCATRERVAAHRRAKASDGRQPADDMDQVPIPRRDMTPPD
ncbi:CGNR zinc finger domain-containing protein [Streptomyces amakusaensis]|uniref:CGNR zinc finger domain-containing protein n=1 Tax=Streptomyces amakusaensis TaxID=67271 RepID=A0ABW0APS2_9ACTN